MNNMLYRGMLKATRLTRAGQLGQATALVQRVLRGQTAPDPGGGATVDSAGAPPGDPSGIIDVTPDVIEARDHQRHLRQSPRPRPTHHRWDPCTC